MEALLFYIQAEWMSSQDATIDLSVVIGMVVRLAMRMGIHRDSKVNAGLTAFQREMRKRIWAQIRVMDTLYSFQLSLPASVRPDECDCELPRNIWSRDFDEYTVSLPPSRPLMENTEVCYIIIKTRLLLVFGKILALTESSDSINTEAVMKYDQELYEIQRDIPPHFKVPSPGEISTASVSIKTTQINLDRVYQAAQCILYRKFLRRDSTQVRYRGFCIDAAMNLLNHQATLFLECASLYPQNMKQRHRFVLTTHDFFIACMAIALDLYYSFEWEPATLSLQDIALWGYDRRNEMITALETSTEFWRASREDSVEAAKGYGMFSFVLQKVKTARRMTRADNGSKPTILGSATEYNVAPLDGPGSMKEAAGWPMEFDLVRPSRSRNHLQTLKKVLTTTHRTYGIHGKAVRDLSNSCSGNCFNMEVTLLTSPSTLFQGSGKERGWMNRTPALSCAYFTNPMFVFAYSLASSRQVKLARRPCTHVLVAFTLFHAIAWFNQVD